MSNFCTVDLSAFYFDVRKDSLYCDHPSDPRRRAARTVMDLLFTCLSRWLAPFLSFTAEEAYLARHPETSGSVHLEQFPDLPETWRDERSRGALERLSAICAVSPPVPWNWNVPPSGSARACKRRPLLYITQKQAEVLVGLDRGRDLHHLLDHGRGRAGAGRRLHACRTSPTLALVFADGRGREVPALLEVCCRMSGRIRMKGSVRPL